MPDLHDKLRGTVAALGDQVNAADLRWDIHNDINRRLITLNAEILSDPENTDFQLSELEGIARDLEDAS